MNKTNSTEIDQQRENEWRGGGAGTSFSDVIIILFPHVTLKHERIIYLSLRPILGFFFFLSFLSFFFFCVCVYVVFPFCCCCCVIPGLYRSRTYNWPVTLGHDPLHRIVVCLEPDRLNYIFSLSLSLSIVVVVVVLFITTKTYSSSRNTHYVSVSLAQLFFPLLPPFCCCCLFRFFFV